MRSQVTNCSYLFYTFNVDLFESKDSTARAGSSNWTVSLNSDFLFFLPLWCNIWSIYHLLRIDSSLLDWFWLFFNPIESRYILMHLVNLVLVLVMWYFLWTWALLRTICSYLISTWVKQDCKIFILLPEILLVVLLFFLFNLFFQCFGRKLLLIITHFIIATTEFPWSKTASPFKRKSFFIITLLLHLLIFFSLNH